MGNYMPFYMVYQKDMEWNDEKMLQRDYEYMKCTYPEVARRILPYVEEECDRLEYSGSIMFDEYPDQVQLRLLCKRIYHRVKVLGLEKERFSEDCLLEMVQVLSCQEIMKRRNEYRKYRRKFY